MNAATVDARRAAQAREYHALRERAHEAAQRSYEFIREQSFLRTADEGKALNVAEYVEALRTIMTEREQIENACARRYNALRAAGVDPSGYFRAVTQDAREGA